MADRFTYGTGMGRTVPDYETGATRLMQAAVEQKKADIAAKRAEVTDSQKAVVDAMSIETIEGLTRGLQDKYQKEISDYRDHVITLNEESEGALTDPQKMDIARKRRDMESRMKSDAFAVTQRDKVRKFLLDPNSQYAYNLPNVMNELSRWDKAMDKGEYLGDPMTILFKHQLEATTGDYLDKRYSNAIESLDVESLGGYEGNVFTETELKGMNVESQEGIAKVRRLRDTMMEDPNIKRKYVARDGRVFEEEKQKVQQEIEDRISSKIKSVQKGYRSAATGTSMYKYANDYELQPVEFGGRSYDLVQLPGDVTASEKPMIISPSDGAVNVTTGEPLSGSTEARVIGVGYNKKTGEPVIMARGEGAYVMKGGKAGLEALDSKGRLGVLRGDLSDKENNKRLASIEDLSNPSKVKESVQATLQSQTENYNIIVDDVTLNPVSESDDIYTVSGSVKYRTKDSKRDKYKKTDNFSYRFRKKKDPKGSAEFELPYDKNKPKVAAWRRKALIDGVDVMNLKKRKAESGEESGFVVYINDGKTYRIPSGEEKAFIAQFPKAKKK